MTYTTLTLPGDNNVYLREKNPYGDRPSASNWDRLSSPTNSIQNWEAFERDTVAAKKILINPVEGKTEYDSGELSNEIQIWVKVQSEWITIEEYPGAYKGYIRRQVFKYIGAEAKWDDMPISKLANAIGSADLKVTFGIQRRHLEIIEVELAKYGNPNMLYSDYLWNDVGKKIGWVPLTIALYYFRYKQSEPTYTTSEVLALLRSMKELCARKIPKYGNPLSESTKQSILSINENELLK